MCLLLEWAANLPSSRWWCDILALAAARRLLWVAHLTLLHGHPGAVVKVAICWLSSDPAGLPSLHSLGEFWPGELIPPETRLAET